MNKPDPVDASQQVDGQAPSAGPAMAPPVSSARRRLIRLGAAAVPVAATVASRPALAWHCQTPSAWGSEVLNPNTSLATKPGHNDYVDETWTCVNWKDNTTRTATGDSRKPWKALFDTYPAVKTACSNNNANVTIAHLVANVPGFKNPGCTTTKKVRSEILASGTTFQKLMVIAQLNDLLLAPSRDWKACLRRNGDTGVAGILQDMADGSYQPAGVGVTWNQTDITNYLTNNWVARLS